jgi:hypothetical protein
MIGLATLDARFKHAKSQFLSALETYENEGQSLERRCIDHLAKYIEAIPPSQGARRRPNSYCRTIQSLIEVSVE